MGRKEVEVKVFRYDPASGVAPHYDHVRIDIEEGKPITVLNLLLRIQQDHLPDLALSYGCRAGQCGSCTIKINGINRLACKTMVEGDVITVEPRDNCEVIRDLVVDTEGDLQKLLEGQAGFKTRLKPPHRVTSEEYHRVAEMRECIECFACMSACPVQGVTSKAKGPLALRNIAQYAFDPRISDLKSRLRSALEAGCYYCTTCKRCTESCDKGIDIRDWIRQLRRSIYYDKTLHEKQPKALAQAMGIIRQSENLLNSDNKTRAEGWGWMVEDEVDVAKFINKKAKVGYFVGCLTSFKPSLDFIAQNTVRILHRIGEDFTILGPEEFCCGFPSYLGGVDEDFMEHNIKAVSELGIEKLVFTCPGCYRAFKVNYPEKLGAPLPFQVKHLSEYLCDKLDAGLTFKHQAPLRLAYHDPCDLGRHSGVYDEPRRVLRGAGVKVVELANNRENAKCCGMGGLLMLTDAEVSIAIGKERIQEVRDAGVPGLVTTCPACTDQFRRLAEGIEVYEMSDIVLRAL